MQKLYTRQAREKLRDLYKFRSNWLQIYLLSLIGWAPCMGISTYSTVQKLVTKATTFRNVAVVLKVSSKEIKLYKNLNK